MDVDDGGTIIVGVFGEDSNGIDQMNDSALEAGAAYVFTRNNEGTWNQQAYLKASNTQAGDQFGYAVDGDGGTVIVGAWREDGSGTGVNSPSQGDNSAFDAGAAYLFTRDNEGLWSQQAYLKASNTEQADRFGYTVAVDGDTVVVTAYGESSNATGVNGDQTDNSASESGAAYVFTHTGGAGANKHTLKHLTQIWVTSLGGTWF